MSKKRNLLFTVSLIVIGLFMLATGFIAGRRATLHSTGFEKLLTIERLIKTNYIDTVSFESLQEETIPLMLSQLDPHSTYLPPLINQTETERLEGSFSGIGIAYNMLIDTVVVVSVTPGGPSSRTDIKPGDRIVSADGKKIQPKEMNQDSIAGILKGPEGSVVTLGVLRNNKSHDVRVVRGEVPVKSIDANYSVAPGILYLHISTWARTTKAEFLSAIAESKRSEQLEGLIIDIRGNSGGYLEAAAMLSNEFLKKGQTILYAEGRAFPREEILADGNGILQDIPLTVLVDEYSASSSEIFAGAMQDHDRAVIIGRRTFGKGLVQRPFELKDGSVVRLAVAHYYTPSGRNIQKPYSQGSQWEYHMDIQERYNHGELNNADSIQIDKSITYTTDSGREVYGGGGITPDIFVSIDTLGFNSYYRKLRQGGVIPEFAFYYTDTNREKLAKFDSYNTLCTYLDKQVLLYKVGNWAARERGIALRPTMLNESSSLILGELYAYIAEAILGRSAFFQVLNRNDQMVSLAIEELAKDKKD